MSGTGENQLSVVLSVVSPPSAGGSSSKYLEQRGEEIEELFRNAMT